MNIDTLHPQLSAENCAFVAMNAFTAALSRLDVMRESPAVQRCLAELEEADTRLSLLLARLRMKETTVNLCNQFGRAP